MKKRILFFLVIFACTNAVHAADGDLDIDFNAGSQGVSPSRPGVHIEQFDGLGFSAIGSEFRGVALQLDEKIVATGLSQSGIAIDPIAVARFNTDGTLDTTSFNSPDGFVLTQFSAFATSYDIMVQPNNKTVIAARVLSGPTAVGLARYNIDGSLDTTFGTDGIAEHNFTAPDLDNVEKIALQSDGKIVIVGYSTTTPESILVARVNANGSVDTSFGGGGGFVSLTPGTGNHRGFDVAVLPDGKILATGEHNPVAGKAAIIIKLTSTGSLDTTFGSGTGFVSEPFAAAGTVDSGRKLLVRSDGKIILIGEGDDDGGIARFTADGTPDDTFGGGGTNQILIPSTTALVSGILQPDDKIVAVGLSNPGAEQSFVVRVTADGVLDPDFGTAGVATFDFDLSGNASELVWDVAIQPSDGYLVLAGQAFVGGELHAYVARIEGSSVATSPPPTFLNLLSLKFKRLLTL